MTSYVVAEKIKIDSECFDAAKKAEAAYFECQLKAKKANRVSSIALAIVGAAQAANGWSKANSALTDWIDADDRVIAATKRNHDFWRDWQAEKGTELFDQALTMDELDYDVCELLDSLKEESRLIDSNITPVHDLGCFDCGQDYTNYHATSLLNGVQRHSKTRHIRKKRAKIELIGNIATAMQNLRAPHQSAYHLISSYEQSKFTSAVNGFRSGMTLFGAEVGRLFTYSRNNNTLSI